MYNDIIRYEGGRNRLLVLGLYETAFIVASPIDVVHCYPYPFNIIVKFYNNIVGNI